MDPCSVGVSSVPRCPSRAGGGGERARSASAPVRIAAPLAGQTELGPGAAFSADFARGSPRGLHAAARRRALRPQCAGAPSAPSAPAAARDARGTVLEFYGAINRRDVEGALQLIAEDCVYEDMIYTEPFRGREEVKLHFMRVLEALPASLVFVVDSLAGGIGGDNAVGMTWHVELKGQPLPFSRGCSFYCCAAQGPPGNQLKIVYARDIPEPSLKPGNIALRVLSLAAFILDKLR